MLTWASDGPVGSQVGDNKMETVAIADFVRRLKILHVTVVQVSTPYVPPSAATEG